MDKNTIIGFILIAGVLIGFSYFSQPSKEEQIEAFKKDSIAAVQQQIEKAKQAEAQFKQEEKNKIEQARLDSSSIFASNRNGEAQIITLKNKVIELDINTHGGVVTRAIIKDYLNQEKQNVELFNPKTSSLNYALALKEENINTKDLFFTPSNITDTTATLIVEGADGSQFVFNYKLHSDTYMLDFSISSKGLERHAMPGNNFLLINWTDSVAQQEKGYDFENRYSTLTYKIKNEGTDYLSETKDDSETPEESLDWIAFKNQFFSYVMIGYKNFTNVKLTSTQLAKGSGYLKHYEAEMRTSFDVTGTQPTTMQFYIGPNQYQLLQDMNDYSIDGKELEMEELVYLGWPLFKYINRYFTIYVFYWLTKMGLPMGVVLLLITLLLKVLVYPTTKKSYMSSAKMRVLRPKLDEISAKYPNKEQNMEKQQEIMMTYSKYGVSPMGGCLPVLLQTPIWIAMFNFVPNAIELRQQSFLWSDDLSTYDSLISWNTSLPLIGDHLSLFCLLFCATNLLYSWINMKMQKDSMVGQQAEQMKMMQWMMMLMPLFFFFIFNDYSAGLNYYYFISLLFSALTMWYLRWRTDDAKLLAKLEENYRKNQNNPQKMKGLAARLEALQQQQREQLKKK